MTTQADKDLAVRQATRTSFLHALGVMLKVVPPPMAALCARGIPSGPWPRHTLWLPP